ncbi:DNA-directed RNA polymerase subunit beta [Candidatus Dependentiae bacterium]|nr:DNA-directed RNA polymerase subunit beta [Candidatus Dependentiae bacterium]
MAQVHLGKGVFRKSFGKIKEVVQLPDLIEIQSKSFNDFAQLDFLPSERKNIGLEKVLRDTFPIENTDKISLEYVSYELGDWECACGSVKGIENRYKWSCSSCKKNGSGRLNEDVCPECGKHTASYTVCKKCSARVFVKNEITADEARYSGKTYSMPLKLKMQLVSWDIDPKTSKKSVKDIKEQEVFFADLPIMVDLFEDDEGSYKLGNNGTFIINGVDRVVVSQLHRAPGAIFTLSKKTKDFKGLPCHIARIIPARGSWIDFEFDSNDVLNVRIDKKKKILATTFLQAMGIAKDSILSMFYDFETIYAKSGDFYNKIGDHLIGQRLASGALSKKLEEKFVVGQRFNKNLIEKLKKEGVKELIVRKSSVVNKILAGDLIDQNSGEIIAQQGMALTQELVDQVSNLSGVVELKVVKSSGLLVQPTLAVTFAHDHVNSKEDALKEIYTKLRPGDVPSLKIMEEYFHNLFFNSRFYDLTVVGRIRTNRKLGLNVNTEITYLTQDDIVATIKYLIGLKESGQGILDDIDHLGNRAVRLVGELLQSQLYSGLTKVEKIVKERFRLQDNYATMMPYDVLNVKPIAAVFREFFGTGQLSQFMDQTNPVAEMAHKRRLSALGPGGLTRERASFEVRDVHPSHYGRICPIETPEGQNIGLISSLSTYARVNDIGFIETPYREVNDGVVSEDIKYLDAYLETGKNIAQASVELDSKNKIKEDMLLVRNDENIFRTESKNVNYLDASPKQLVSVATALIPFLEHDDANRALMGSNMQRQAVPLVKCQYPLVGTGMEHEIGTTQGIALLAQRSGVVEYVSGEKIEIGLFDTTKSEKRWFSRPVDVYKLKKFARSSHSTWIHYTPVVRVGDKIEKGDVIANGAATLDGDLSLGSNVLVAFMPWRGYNFEDAIVLSKRLVSDDVFTSVHVEEFIVEARDTKLGAEEITRDIPNVGEKDLAALDEDGIVRIGTRVKPGDILVGKVTLKGDIQVSPEEKLLRAIFGEKSREVRDTSLRVPPGVEATVLDVKVFSKSGIRKDKRYKDFVQKQTEIIEDDYASRISILQKGVKNKIKTLLSENSISNVKIQDTKYSVAKLENLDVDMLLTLESGNKNIDSKIKDFSIMLSDQIQVLTSIKADMFSRLRKGDDLPSGVLKMVKVYVAAKRHVSVGDKMAGRHGNKGVVSQIVNIEDMPFMDDGTSVDIVLNPLGVPGRMNVGQILETILGFAGKKISANLAKNINELSYKELKKQLAELYSDELVDSIEKSQGQDAVKELADKTVKNGLAFKTPIFDGASYQNIIVPLLKDLGMSANGAYTLFDGKTGLRFDQPVTVGYIYMMKLNHLADDKLHARSVGPYSLITQQPLGGKAQFGGQRLGEMEVWALYAYGAAYTLQEMLTVKSDDVNGRIKAYEAIVRGDDVPVPGIPESFNVLVKELQSLGLQVDLFKASKEQVSE